VNFFRGIRRFASVNKMQNISCCATFIIFQRFDLFCMCHLCIYSIFVCAVALQVVQQKTNYLLYKYNISDVMLPSRIPVFSNTFYISPVCAIYLIYLKQLHLQHATTGSPPNICPHDVIQIPENKPKQNEEPHLQIPPPPAESKVVPEFCQILPRSFPNDSLYGVCQLSCSKWKRL